jgi:hypothetical protein
MPVNVARRAASRASSWRVHPERRSEVIRRGSLDVCERTQKEGAYSMLTVTGADAIPLQTTRKSLSPGGTL